MAYSLDFSVSQGANVKNIILTDISTGSDPNLTGKTVYLYQTDNTLLGGATIPWPLSAGSILTISDILVPWDFSLNILVTAQSSSPIPGSSYSKNHLATFTGNSNSFAYSLLQQISSNQAITRDTNYLYNLALVNSDILNAIRANDFGDIGAAQEALNRIYSFYINRAFYF